MFVRVHRGGWGAAAEDRYLEGVARCGSGHFLAPERVNARMVGATLPLPLPLPTSTTATSTTATSTGAAIGDMRAWV